MATNTLRMIIKLRVLIKLETNKEPSRYYVDHISGERRQYIWLQMITGLIINDSYFSGGGVWRQLLLWVITHFMTVKTTYFSTSIKVWNQTVCPHL